MKIREMTVSERPREKMVLYGRETLTNSELLAVLLKTGTKEHGVLHLAEKVLNAGGLRNLAECSLEELTAFEGIGEAKACVLHAAIELGRRIATAEVLTGGTVGSVEDVVDIFMEKLRYMQKEVFEVLLLNAKGHIIARENVSVGDLCSSVVHPRETFKSAIKRSAAAVIFIHNHPSGDPTPSDDDVTMTKRLIEAGNILGISVLDHIIIGDGTYISMKAKGII